MKYQLLLVIYIIFFTACSKVPVQIPIENPPIKDSLLLIETFETPQKNNYNNYLMPLNSGQWIIANALFGTSANDQKNGTQSVRIIGNGSINMAFCVNLGSETKIEILSSRFGNSAKGKWYLLASNNGATYEKISDDIEVATSSLTLTTVTYNKKGWTSFAIQKIEDGSTLNFDDFSITTKTPDYNTNYIAPPSYINNYTFNNGTGTSSTGVIMGPVGKDSALYPLSGDNSSLLLGNPSNAIQNASSSANNYLLISRYYSSSYNNEKAIPNWVAWHLDKSNYGAVKRQDSYLSNDYLPENFYKVLTTDYSSGYSKGHNCPSGDRTSSVEANDAVFYMTNMIPQTTSNNNGVWNNFENYCRSLTDGGNECYIIMGSYGSGGSIASGRISVPTNIWKVVVVLPNGNNDISRINANTRVIAINTPNTDNVNSDWKTYRTSINAIENATGYTLLSAIPANIKQVLAGKVDNQ